MIVLGIESSCDETAAAVIADGTNLLSNVVFSSMDLHKAYGGVVPEIAARSHVESIIPVIDQALEQAFAGQTNLSNDDANYWNQIDAIAVTYGAGLSGSLLVGVTTAKTLAIMKNKPLYAINHVEAHVYANFITTVEKAGDYRLNSSKTKIDKLDRDIIKVANPLDVSLDSTINFGLKSWTLNGQEYKLPIETPKFPILALIVSGGHTQLALFKDHFKYQLLGQTRDDAIGEAFDKVAKIIGLPYPGGPSVSKAALEGDQYKYNLPKAKLDKPYEFSFSGLKTAVLRLAQAEIGQDYTFPSHQVPERLSGAQKYDIAASFQRIAIETLVDKTVAACEEFRPCSVVIAGGVAANNELRTQLSARFKLLREKNNSLPNNNYKLPIPTYTDIKLCTDNGAMIATLGCFKVMLNQPPVDPYTIQIEPNLSM